MRLSKRRLCVGDLYARRTVVLRLRSTLAPLYGCIAGYPSLHLLRPCGCTVLDDALLYLSAVILRVHDAADN